MGSYLGFSVQQMLNFLRANCERVELKANGDNWILYTSSDYYGEFESVGGLLTIVSDSFKPFSEQAIKERESANLF